MADKQWPQGTPGASVPLTDAVEFGSYNSADPGATKNVKYTALEIKTYAEGTLSTDIAQNASDIADNTSAIGVNAGLINDNVIATSAVQSQADANTANIETKLDASEYNSKVDQGVKTTDSPAFVSGEYTGNFFVNGDGSDLKTILSSYLAVGESCSVIGGGLFFNIVATDRMLFPAIITRNSSTVYGVVGVSINITDGTFSKTTSGISDTDDVAITVGPKITP